MNVEPITLAGKNGSYIFEPKDILSLNGRFGSVFKGKIAGTEVPVVLKFLSPKRGGKAAEFRFKMEAFFTFGRPDIQDALDFIQTDKGLFLVKQYIPGKTLKQTKTNKVSFIEWKESLLSLLDTLDFLHQKGITHGDIKPANIIWPKSADNQPDKPVLLDFGLARLNSVSYNDSLFSFIYSPPEQLLGFGHLMGVSSDLFALGVTFYEAITNEPAYDFDTENGPAILEQAQLAFPLAKNSALPDDWFVFISYLCQKPAFRKPHRHYSKPEQEKLLLESLGKRPSDIQRVKEMALRLSTEKPRKNIWRIFG